MPVQQNNGSEFPSSPIASQLLVFNQVYRTVPEFFLLIGLTLNQKVVGYPHKHSAVPLLLQWAHLAWEVGIVMHSIPHKARLVADFSQKPPWHLLEL